MTRNKKNKLYYSVIPFTAVYNTAILSKLKSGAHREEIGSIIDYRTPLYSTRHGGKSFIQKHVRISGVKGRVPAIREELVDRFFKQVVIPNIKNPDYLEGEDKFMKYKGSSRSVKLPFSLVFENAIQPYFKNAQKKIPLDVQEALLAGLNTGIKKLDLTIPPKSLRLLSLEGAMDEVPATTNGGAPYFLPGKEMRGKEVILDNRSKYLDIASKLQKYPYKKIPDRLLLLNSFFSIGRGQESNDPDERGNGVVVPKQRRPGAEGHAGTIIGERMKPFLDKRADNPTRAALVNQKMVDEVIYNSGKEMSNNSGMISGDGSSYDTHMMPGLGELIGEAIVDRFQCSKEDRAAMMNYFHHVFHDPLITPKGILGGKHGMPSGTTFTNELDSCYNEVLVESFKFLPLKYKLGCDAELITVTDQGDDLVVEMKINSKDHPAMDDEEVVKEILSKAYEAMNMAVNPRKQMVSRRKCEYLKRLHLKGIKESYRSYTGSLIGMINMEHAKDGKDAMYSARWIMQAANHYSNLEGFDEFMKFIANGDEVYHLGVGSKGGALGILQMAGGADSVIKRLGYKAYTTHLGVDVTKGEASLASNLSSAAGVKSQNVRR